MIAPQFFSKTTLTNFNIFLFEHVSKVINNISKKSCQDILIKKACPYLPHHMLMQCPIIAPWTIVTNHQVEPGSTPVPGTKPFILIIAKGSHIPSSASSWSGSSTWIIFIVKKKKKNLKLNYKLLYYK